MRDPVLTIDRKVLKQLCRLWPADEGLGRNLQLSTVMHHLSVTFLPYVSRSAMKKEVEMWKGVIACQCSSLQTENTEDFIFLCAFLHLGFKVVSFEGPPNFDALFYWQNGKMAKCFQEGLKQGK